MSIFGITWAAIRGVFSWKSTAAAEIASYVMRVLLAALNKFVSNKSAATKERIESVLTVAKTCLMWLKNLTDAIPAKWQDEYGTSVAAVETVVDVLSDLKVTPDEVQVVYAKFVDTYAAWEAD